MTDYCHIENGIIDGGPRNLPRSWRNVSGLDLASPEELRDKGWLPVRYVDESFDPAAQVRTGPVGSNIGDAVSPDADEVVGTYTVRDKTAQELADDQRTQDIEELRDAGKDAVLLLIELIDWQIANSTLDPASFPAPVRQAYQRLKPIADRIIS